MSELKLRPLTPKRFLEKAGALVEGSGHWKQFLLQARYVYVTGRPCLRLLAAGRFGSGAGAR